MQNSQRKFYEEHSVCIMKNTEYGLRKMQSMFHDSLNTQSVFNEIVE
jgi:hypothetical protein